MRPEAFFVLYFSDYTHIKRQAGAPIKTVHVLFCLSILPTFWSSLLPSVVIRERSGQRDKICLYEADLCQEVISVNSDQMMYKCRRKTRIQNTVTPGLDGGFTALFSEEHASGVILSVFLFRISIVRLQIIIGHETEDKTDSSPLVRAVTCRPMFLC